MLKSAYSYSNKKVRVGDYATALDNVFLNLHLIQPTLERLNSSVGKVHSEPEFSILRNSYKDTELPNW